jgi:hypothetical protein
MLTTIYFLFLMRVRRRPRLKNLLLAALLKRGRVISQIKPIVSDVIDRGCGRKKGVVLLGDK